MPRRLGIVLSGGGSRGLVHAGILKALTEAGIAPVCIAGNSSGALIGALYAAGYACEDMLRFFDDTNPFRFSRFALRKAGFLDSEKIIEDLKRWFPETFEALALGLFVVATDLIAGELVTFSTGPLIGPLLASASMPFVFTPTHHDGRLFVDGGVLNNFPIEPLLGQCEVILGVYASPLHDSSGAFGSSFAVTQRAFAIGMHQASRRKFAQAALVLCPPDLAGYATFDIKRHREIAEIGYQAAIARMDDIGRLLAD